MKYAVYLFVSLFLGGLLRSQTIVNAYAQVVGVTNNSVLTVANVNQTYHNFTVGEKVVVMVMQDDVIGSNTANTASFGDLATIANAGKFEIKNIAARSPASGTPTSITISPAITGTYNLSVNSSAQLITFRNLGANYTTSAVITAPAWNGNVGGVLAFEVTNTLTLNHPVTVSGLGFRGGLQSANADEVCASSVYITNSNLKAYKGEGIYRVTNANYTNGRGKILNGGGGGSQNNTGGGGGGNYSGGGNGGVGYNCTTSNSGYGLGAVTLSTNISGSRVFMGGGGGGGQGNNNQASDGASGGGIILIKATTISTGTVCGTPIQITASGATAANTGNDGGGGGGAGGSIILQVNNFSISATCPMTVAANGGAGGNVNNGSRHGGGGGGGQGAIIYALTSPTANVTSQTNVGAGGANSNSTADGYAANGGGVNGGGILPATSTPLPIELLSFYAEQFDEDVILRWTTATEKNNQWFIVEKSLSGYDFYEVTRLAGAENSLTKRQYMAVDKNLSGPVCYYRLRQLDLDGSSTLSPVIVINFKREDSFAVFPNPLTTGQNISLQANIGSSEHAAFSIINADGRIVHEGMISAGSGYHQIELNQQPLEKGIYFLKLSGFGFHLVKKLVVQ